MDPSDLAARLLRSAHRARHDGDFEAAVELVELALAVAVGEDVTDELERLAAA
jgi:transposase